MGLWFGYEVLGKSSFFKLQSEQKGPPQPTRWASLRVCGCSVLEGSTCWCFGMNIFSPELCALFNVAR